MKKWILVLSICFYAGFAFSQEVAIVVADTIIMISGKKVLSSVQGVSSTKITYIPFGKTEVKEVERKQVHKIKYKNGRVESFNSLAMQMVAEGDWKTIIITDKKSEVEGFVVLGEVDAKSSARVRDAKSAQRSAEIILKKKAANMGGLVILVTKRESKGGYGEVPSHKVEGVVYGFAN
jgi:hypothetical protein